MKEVCTQKRVFVFILPNKKYFRVNIRAGLLAKIGGPICFSKSENFIDLIF